MIYFHICIFIYIIIKRTIKENEVSDDVIDVISSMNSLEEM